MAFHYTTSYIDFSANTDDEVMSTASITNENLADYEYGTWAPGLGNGSYGSGGISVGAQTNTYYTKIGNVVYCTARFAANHNSSTNGTTLLMRYLPFTPQEGSAGHGVICYKGGTGAAGKGANSPYPNTDTAPIALSGTPHTDPWQFNQPLTATGTSGVTNWGLGFTYFTP